MTDNDYAYWQQELADPGCNARDTDRTDLAGFYRIAGARTKPDYPVAIWRDEDGKLLAMIGFREIKEGSADFFDFLGSAWTKADAVDEDAYRAAVDAGRWADGKPARAEAAPADDDEIVETAPEDGGNAPPPHELWQEKIAKLVARAKAFVTVTTMKQAEDARALSDELKKAWETTDKLRAAEKKPHDDASKAVQEKWMPKIVTPAKLAREQIELAIQTFARAEQKRKDEEARQERLRIEEENRKIEAERQRLADEAARIEEENRRVIEAAMEAGEQIDEEELQAVPVALPELKPLPQAERVMIGGSPFARRTGARKVKRGVITNYDVLYAAMKNQQWMKDFVQERVDAIARTKDPVLLDGMKIEEE